MSSLLPGDLGGMYPMEKYLWPCDFSSKIQSTFQLVLYSNYYLSLLENLAFFFFFNLAFLYT